MLDKSKWTTGESYTPDDSYSNKLSAERQVSMEEAIASRIFEKTETAGCDGCGTLDEEDCANLGRDILKLILQEFRPDVFNKS